MVANLPPCGATCLGHRLHTNYVYCQINPTRTSIRCITLTEPHTCQTILEWSDGRTLVHRTPCPTTLYHSGGGGLRLARN